MFIKLRILLNDYLDKRYRKKLIKKIYMDDRIPSSEYTDPDRFI